jgi:O-antigen/teichoic acid export membrane protein
MGIDAGPRIWSTVRKSLPAQVGQSWVLVAAMLASHLLSYLFQLFMSRTLPAPEFGLLNGLMAFSLLLTIPVNTIQLTMARQTAETLVHAGVGRVRGYLRADLRRATPWILGGIAAYSALSPALASFFHTSLVPIWLVGGISLIALYSPFPEGVLQGMQRFQALAAILFTRYVGKLALGVLLVTVGLGVEGALGGLLLSRAAAALLAFMVVAAGREAARSELLSSAQGADTSPRDLWPTLVAYASVLTLTNVDVALARHYLPATDSAHYAIAALLGKIAYYLPSFVIVIVVPKVASARASGWPTMRYLVSATLTTLAASGSVVMVYGLFPQQVISLLFGAGYASAATSTLVFYYSVTMVVLSVLYLEVHYLLARRHTRPLYGLIAGPTIAVLGMVVWHGDGLELVVALMLGLLAGLLALNLLAVALKSNGGDSRSTLRGDVMDKP